MMQNWTKTITRKNEDDQKFQKSIQKILSIAMYIYKKKILIFKIIYGI